LGQYGRNNICYTGEFGSYTQIMTYISSLPCDETAWLPIGRMERCENCRACVDSCPTGAIDSDRRLIDSDRCITHANESRENFPEWIDKNAHNSIIGCIKCQDCCPANVHNKNNITMGAEFTEEETTEFLNHKYGEPYTGSLAVKLEAAGILSMFVTTMPRNLAVLFANDAASHKPIQGHS
jgi:epoxyqueuosine reductase